MTAASPDQNTTSGLLLQSFLVDALRPDQKANEIDSVHFGQVDACLKLGQNHIATRHIFPYYLRHTQLNTQIRLGDYRSRHRVNYKVRK
jgi:hypothetical protein